VFDVTRAATAVVAQPSGCPTQHRRVYPEHRII